MRPERAPEGEPLTGRLSAWVTRAEAATGKHLVIRRVFDLRTRRNFNDFKGIVFVFSVLLALHDQHIFEALVIRGTVKSRAVAKTIKFKAFKCCNNTTRIECTGTLAGICIEQGLGVNGLSGIGWREAVFGAEGFNERFGALVLQGP